MSGNTTTTSDQTNDEMLIGVSKDDSISLNNSIFERKLFLAICCRTKDKLSTFS